jgi:hypothetical protein
VNNADFSQIFPFLPKGLIPRALFLGEIFRMFLLNCEHSSRNNLFEWSQIKRNRRNNSHFAEKKRPWNQAFTLGNIFAKQIFLSQEAKMLLNESRNQTFPKCDFYRIFFPVVQSIL